MQRLIVGALVLVAIVAGAFLLLPRLVPEQDVRAAVTRALADATGTEPRIAGDVRLTLVPRPAIRLDGVRLDDGERAGITTGSLLATVRLMPLLVGRIEIAAITFERPHLALQVDAEGVRIVGLPLYPRMPGGPRAGAPELRIVDGTIELHLPGGERMDPFTALEASLAWSGSGLTASGTFDWGRLPVAATLVVGDTGALRKGARSTVRLRLEAEDLRYTFDGGLAFRNGPQLEGTQTADGKSLRKLLALLGVDAPARGGFAAFSLKSKVALTPGALALSALSVDLDGNLAEGGITIKRSGARAVIQGTLASELVDLNRYATPGKSGERTDGWAREAIDFTWLEAADLDLRFSARRVRVSGTELERVALTAGLKSGRLTLAIGETQAFGGTLRGTATLGLGALGPEARIEASLTDFSIERSLTDLAVVKRLEGTGVLALALTGSGTSLEAIGRALAGEANLTITKGAIAGVNIEQILRRLERKPLSGFGDLRGGRTPFERISAKLRFVEGSAMLEELQVDSPALRVTLAGAASIPRRDLDLRGIASLVRPASITTGANPKGFELPFIVQGPWDQPLLLPDTEALIRRSGAAAPLLDAVRSRSTRGTIRSVIESLTGARQTEAPVAHDAPVAAPATVR